MTYATRLITRASLLSLAIAGAAGAQSTRAALERAPTPAPRASRAAEADAEGTQGAVRFWSALGDTTLVRLVGEALQGNQELQAVRARVGSARAARTTSLLDLAPVVTAVGGYSRQRMASAGFPGAGGAAFPEQNVWDAGLRMQWEVDVFGRLRHTAQARGAQVLAADEDVQDVRVVLSAEVARAYFQLRGAQDRLRVARRNAENQQRTLEVTVNRLEAGRGTALDRERAQAQLSTTLAAIPALEAEVDAAADRITILAGRAPEAGASSLGEAAVAALPESVAVGAAEAVARRRPDVRSAEQQLAASSASVRAARADYLPRLALAGGAGYTTSRLDALGTSGTPRFTIGPVISWPAFDLARVKAGTDAARAAESESQARYRDAMLRSMAEVTTAVTTYEKSRARLRHLEDAAAASERAAELARLRFTEGASDFLPVLDAERTMLEAQDRLAQGRIATSAALVQVYRATGGLR
jgi:multidrug efflux system outer membrane protein